MERRSEELGIDLIFCQADCSKSFGGAEQGTGPWQMFISSIRRNDDRLVEGTLQLVKQDGSKRHAREEPNINASRVHAEVSHPSS